MKVVLDTNVLVSGLINVKGIPAQKVNLLVNGRITLLYDSRILKEYEEVLFRKKFGFKKSVIGPIVDYIRHEGEYVTAEPTDNKGLAYSQENIPLLTQSEKGMTLMIRKDSTQREPNWMDCI